MLYSRYAMDHYMLDFKYDESWTFNVVGETQNKIVSAVLYANMQIVWFFSVMLSKFTTWILGEAYDFDLISRAIDGLSNGLQRLFGLSHSGLGTRGFLPEFLIFTLLFLGAYVIWFGMLKREHTKAYGAVVNYIVVFLVSAAFILNAGTYTKLVNDVSNDVSQSILSVGTNFVSGATTGNSNVQKGDSSLSEIKEMLFNIQIREPWIYLEFGSADKNAISSDRIQSIESRDFGSEERSDAVEDEVDDENKMLTQHNQYQRLVSVMLLFLLNVMISFFVMFFAALLLIAQILLLVYVYILPVAFIIGLLPGKHMVAYNGISRAFQFMFAKIGVSFILMITFSLSSFLYQLTDDKVLIFRGLLQVICYVGVFKSLGKLSRMLGAKSVEEAAQKKQEAKEWKRRHVDPLARKAVYKTVRAAAAGITGGQSESFGAGAAAENATEQQFQKRDAQKTEKERAASDIYQSEEGSGSDRQDTSSEGGAHSTFARELEYHGYSGERNTSEPESGTTEQSERHRDGAVEYESYTRRQEDAGQRPEADDKNGNSSTGQAEYESYTRRQEDTGKTPESAGQSRNSSAGEKEYSSYSDRTEAGSGEQNFQNEFRTSSVSGTSTAATSSAETGVSDTSGTVGTDGTAVSGSAETAAQGAEAMSSFRGGAV